MIEATAGLSFTSNNAPDIGVNPINGLLTVVRATEIERPKGEEEGLGERDESGNTRGRKMREKQKEEEGENGIMKNRWESRVRGGKDEGKRGEKESEKEGGRERETDSPRPLFV